MSKLLFCDPLVPEALASFPANRKNLRLLEEYYMEGHQGGGARWVLVLVAGTAIGIAVWNHRITSKVGAKVEAANGLHWSLSSAQSRERRAS